MRASPTHACRLRSGPAAPRMLRGGGRQGLGGCRRPLAPARLRSPALPFPPRRGRRLPVPGAQAAAAGARFCRGRWSALAAPVRRAWHLGGAGPPCGCGPQVGPRGRCGRARGPSPGGERPARSPRCFPVPGPGPQHRVGAVGPLARRGSAGDARLPTGRRGGRGSAERGLRRLASRALLPGGRAHLPGMGSEPGQLGGILARAGASGRARGLCGVAWGPAGPAQSRARLVVLPRRVHSHRLAPTACPALLRDRLLGVQPNFVSVSFRGGGGGREAIFLNGI